METEIDIDKMEGVKEKIVKIAGLIQGCKFAPKPSYQSCKYCDYRSVCEDVFN